jgi:glycosyltransferase involved in cell wall biosynthesis
MSKQKILEKRIGVNVNQMPQVSIVIPAYNVAEFIGETLDSVLAQTVRNYEIILVNDGSPDSEKLEAVLENYFENIIYIKQTNGGTARARNTAIGAARGEFLAFLDGDDVWLPEYLAMQINALKVKNCDLIYTDALLFGCVKNKSETFMKKSPSRGTVKTESLIEGICNIITSGTVVRREKVLECGLFDEDLPRIGMEDFDLWFRLLKMGARLDYQRRVLLKYRVRPESLSGSNVQRAQRSVVVLDIIERKHRLSDSEKRAVTNHRKLVSAELKLENGKLNLTQGNYNEALADFRQANEYYRKIKLKIVIWLLKVNPDLVLKVFKKMRATDFTFTVPNNSTETAIIPRVEN